jgi:hypothetical protein
MAAFRVMVALTWFVCVLTFSVEYLYEERMSGGGWFIVITAIVFTTLTLIEQAIDAVDRAVDRRSQI